MNGIDQSSLDGMSLAESFSSFWPCAVTKIAEAEKALDVK
jgi:hypothetical protein